MAHSARGTQHDAENELSACKEANYTAAYKDNDGELYYIIIISS